MWNCATTPFIQVTWDGTEVPIRQTTSLAGAEEPELDVPLEPQPAMPAAAPASATAAPIAAADLVKFTARSPFPALSVAEPRPPGGRLRPGRLAAALTLEAGGLTVLATRLTLTRRYLPVRAATADMPAQKLTGKFPIR